MAKALEAAEGNSSIREPQEQKLMIFLLYLIDAAVKQGSFPKVLLELKEPKLEQNR